MKKNLLLLTTLFLTGFLATNLGNAQPRIKFLTLASGFDLPVDIAFAGSGDPRVFVAENSGVVKIVKGHDIVSTPFLDLSAKTKSTGNGGLLSIAFHPDYLHNGYFFVYYTEKTSASRSSGAITLARYKVSSNPDIADPASEVIVMKVLKPVKADGSVALEHNGGKLNFGQDGNLYFATGDGIEAYPGDPFLTAQNRESLLGKMIRINVNNFNSPPYYSVPIDNPLNYMFRSGKKEIWSVGLRNPFRWSFDRLNGDMFIADVGQEKWEEINYTAYKNPISLFIEWLVALFHRKGAQVNIPNYGWSCYEGTDPYNISKCNSKENFVFPAYEYPHVVADGQKRPASVIGGYVYRGKSVPDLYGYYLAADLFSGDVYFIKKDADGKWQTNIQTGHQTGIVTFGEDPEGELYATSLATRELYKITVAPPIATVSKSVARTADTNINHGALKKEGITDDESKSFKVYPTIITTGAFKVQLNKPAIALQMVSVDGSPVYQKDLKKLLGSINVDVPNLSKGTYFVRIISNSGIETKKVIVQ